MRLIPGLIVQKRRDCTHGRVRPTVKRVEKGGLLCASLPTNHGREGRPLRRVVTVLPPLGRHPGGYIHPWVHRREAPWWVCTPLYTVGRHPGGYNLPYTP